MCNLRLGHIRCLVMTVALFYASVKLGNLTIKYVDVAGVSKAVYIATRPVRWVDVRLRLKDRVAKTPR